MNQKGAGVPAPPLSAVEKTSLALEVFAATQKEMKDASIPPGLLTVHLAHQTLCRLGVYCMLASECPVSKSGKVDFEVAQLSVHLGGDLLLTQEGVVSKSEARRQMVGDPSLYPPHQWIEMDEGDWVDDIHYEIDKWGRSKVNSLPDLILTRLSKDQLQGTTQPAPTKRAAARL